MTTLQEQLAQPDYAELVMGIAPANLLRYYPLLGVGSELVRDMMGNANGTAEGGLVGGGAASLINGERERTALFDGSNDAIDCGTPPTLTTAFTIAVWINSADYTSADQHYVCSVYDTIGNRCAWAIKFHGNNCLQVSFGNPANGTFAGASISQAQWYPADGVRYHIAVTFAPGDCRYYVDGAPRTWGTHYAPASIYQSSAPLMIGTFYNRTAGSFWLGSMCHMAIWNAALDADQIKSLYLPGA